VGTDVGDEPLHIQIEAMLDQMLPLIKEKRRDVVFDNDSESASDDDY